MNDIFASPPIAAVFKELPALSRRKVRQIFHPRQFLAGEAVYRQEDPATAIYLIVEGHIKVERITQEGYQSILCVRGPGDFFCPVPILDAGVQLGTARAMTDVTLLWANREEFHALCQECPEFLALVQHDCLLEVRRMLNRMESFAFHRIEERLAFTIFDESRRQATNDKPLTELRITQQELAGLVGASRESVSRILSNELKT
ncbi:MAG: Crp/Fnr family transcriptional regulator [Chloroflexi bacterium]|nr:Crp/Fnr family transcriptional regulator [Chloroflexota bacterium]